MPLSLPLLLLSGLGRPGSGSFMLIAVSPSPTGLSWLPEHGLPWTFSSSSASLVPTAGASVVPLGPER